MPLRYRPEAEVSLQVGQLNGAVVLPLLDMIPYKLICHPGGLLLDQLRVVKVRISTDGKPLAAIAADNGPSSSSVGERFGWWP